MIVTHNMLAQHPYHYLRMHGLACTDAILDELSVGFTTLEGSAIAIASASIPATYLPYNALVHEVLARIGLYMMLYVDQYGLDAVKEHVAKLQNCPKPWTPSSISINRLTRVQVNKRAVRDFGETLAGARPNVLQQGTPPKLDELQNFSEELLRAEALLPIYMENT